MHANRRSAFHIAVLGLCLAWSVFFSWQTFDLGTTTGLPAAADPDYEKAWALSDRMHQAALENPVGYRHNYLNGHTVYVKGKVQRVLPGGEVFIKSWGTFNKRGAGVLCIAALDDVVALEADQKVRAHGEFAGLGQPVQRYPGSGYRVRTVLIDPCTLVAD